MITGELRTKVDKLWEEFWTGGITNPLTVIEQITFLMFSRLLDLKESNAEKLHQHSGKPFNSAFGADGQHMRWQNFRQKPAEEMLKVVRDEVFPHFKNAAMEGVTFGDFMRDAQLMIQKPSLLVSAVNMIESLPLQRIDTKGDLYEYLLGKLTTAGINGQFRTPRHVIQFMVELAAPQPEWSIGDPACGTGGFLISTMEYLCRKHSSAAGTIVAEDGHKTYTGDQLQEHWDHIQNHMFHGFDFDTTMLRIASMNLMLHGVSNPNIHYQDTLSGKFPDRFPNRATDGFDLILANPPFKGSLDEGDVAPDLLRTLKTKKTELLFLVLMLRMLRKGGRCTVVIPQGVQFGASRSHIKLRKMLVEENQLEAVISLPAGVFRPYAGVATAILIFAKGGATEQVFFADVQADGFSLNDKRESIPEDDLPEILERWRKRDPQKDTDRTSQVFYVPVEELRDSRYDLSFNRYQELRYEEEEYEPPQEILERMKALNTEIANDLIELERMLE